MGVDFQVEAIRDVERSDTFATELSGGLIAQIHFLKEHQLNALMVSWRAHLAKRESGEYPEQTGEAPEITPADQLDFLRERFQDFGYSKVVAQRTSLTTEEQADAELQYSTRFQVAVHSDFPLELAGAHELSLFFGALSTPLTDASLAETVVAMQIGVAQLFVGFIGMLILLSVCGSFVPNMLQKGTIDLILARPISRGGLLLSKYVGVLIFIFGFTTVLLTGCWLGISWRSGYWNPWFIVCALTGTAQFAVLYAVALLFGVWTRSSNIATLLSLSIWGASSTVSGLHHVGGWLDNFPRIQQMLTAAYYVLPNTPDLASLNLLFLSRSYLSPEAYERTIAPQIPEIDWWVSGGTTVLFTVATLAFAVWLFRRKDF
jgi:ABC-type transport system involved in multi-copper enzyme maturation permease subunit